MLKEFLSKDYTNRWKVLTQADLEAYCSNVDRLDSIWLNGNVRGYKVNDFSCLNKLALKRLVVADALTQEQFIQICNLTTIETLSLQHVGKITNLLPISKLKNLHSLSLGTPLGWIPKTKHFDSMKALEPLKQLVKLDFRGVTFDSPILSSLKKMPNLNEVYSAMKYFDEILLININEDCKNHIIQARERYSQLRRLK